MNQYTYLAVLLGTGSAIHIHEASSKEDTTKGSTQKCNGNIPAQQDKTIAAPTNRSDSQRRPATIPKSAWRKMTPAVRKAVSEAISIARQEGVKEGKRDSESATQTARKEGVKEGKATTKRDSESATQAQIEAKRLKRKQERAKKKQRKQKKQQRKKALAANKAAKSIKEKIQASESELRDAFPDWMDLSLSLDLVRNIVSSGFQAPTPIQKLSIPLVYRQRRHVIGM